MKIKEGNKLSITQQMLIKECDSIKELLLQKNLEYGNSVVSPKRIFSTASNIEQINVRIDDKLSRIMYKGNKEIQEDTDIDLIGYLILRQVVKKYNLQIEASKSTTSSTHCRECNADNGQHLSGCPMQILK